MKMGQLENLLYCQKGNFYKKSESENILIEMTNEAQPSSNFSQLSIARQPLMSSLGISKALKHYILKSTGFRPSAQCQEHNFSKKSAMYDCVVIQLRRTLISSSILILRIIVRSNLGISLMEYRLSYSAMAILLFSDYSKQYH